MQSINFLSNSSFQIAPMIDWSHRHCRYFMRLLSRKALLYTEMISSNALRFGSVEKHLSFDPFEKPLILQIAGSNPKHLQEAVNISSDYPYNGINLNVGCPSPRVQKAQWGVAMMKDPFLVQECLAAMIEKSSVPISIKHRIGVDNNDSYEELSNFISIVAKSGCKKYIIHGRKAYLHGLNPKQNRNIPPLIPEYVWRIKKDFPNLQIIYNGGLKSIKEGYEKIITNKVDGVMFGRLIMNNPANLLQIDPLYGANPSVEWSSLLLQYRNYIEEKLTKGVPSSYLFSPIMNLFKGKPGGKTWRQMLNQRNIEGYDIACKKISLN